MRIELQSRVFIVVSSELRVPGRASPWWLRVQFSAFGNHKLEVQSGRN